MAGKNLSFDAIRTGVPQEKVAFTLLRSLYAFTTHATFEDSYLESFGLVEDGNLTNAGLLFADIGYLRTSRIFCTRWNGLTKASGLGEALNDIELEDSIINQYRQGVQFIETNTKNPWRKTAQGRVNTPDYPKAAYEEALMNAIVHRDYTQIGTEIHVDIFDDRIEIYSPGGMVDGRDIQDRDLQSIPSKRRNPIVADCFSRMSLIERRGSGIRKMLEAYTNAPHYIPQHCPTFYSDETMFRVIFRNLNYAEVLPEGFGSGSGNSVGREDVTETRYARDSENTTVTAKTSETRSADSATTDHYIASLLSASTAPRSVEVRRALVLAIFKLAPNYQVKRLADILEVSKRTVERDIRHLRENGMISFSGGTKNGTWTVHS